MNGRNKQFVILLDNMECHTQSRVVDESPPKKKLKHISGDNNIKRNLTSLPRNVLLKIFSYLDQKSITNCAMVCSAFNRLCQDSSLYKSIVLKYNMTIDFLGSLVTRTSRPQIVQIEYKFHDQSGEVEDYYEFDEWVQILFQKCCEHILSLKIESCHNDKILLYIGDCTQLRHLSLYRCKSSFLTLPLLDRLRSVTFVFCQFPSKIVNDMIKNNGQLRNISLTSNVNVNPNEICETMSKWNAHVEKINFSEKKKMKTKSLKTLGRLSKLRWLELILGPGFDSDVEDVLEKIASGCPHLEKLVIYGWSKLNDDNFIPAVQMCTQLKELDLRGTDITIKSCREAALSLPLLQSMDVVKCRRIKKAELKKLQKDFEEVDIALE